MKTTAKTTAKKIAQPAEKAKRKAVHALVDAIVEAQKDDHLMDDTRYAIVSGRPLIKPAPPAAAPTKADKRSAKMADVVKPAKKAAKKAAKPAAEKTDSLPRETSKAYQVIQLLKRPGGAKLDEINTKFGWQQHTTRALMSKGGAIFKKHGLTVASEKNDAGERIYRIA